MLLTTFPPWLDVSYFLDIHSFYLYYLLSILSSTVPVNKLPEKDGSQRFYQEKISYEHQYNSRWQKNYPIRSTVSVQFIQLHALHCYWSIFVWVFDPPQQWTSPNGEVHWSQGCLPILDWQSKNTFMMLRHSVVALFKWKLFWGLGLVQYQ